MLSVIVLSVVAPKMTVKPTTGYKFPRTHFKRDRRKSSFHVMSTSVPITSKMLEAELTVRCQQSQYWRHDPQHNNTQHKDTEHDNPQHNI